MNTNYMEEILARLRAGENVDTIASQLTKDINAANEAYIQEQKRAKEAEEHLRVQKVEAMDHILNGLYDLLSLYDVDASVRRTIAYAKAEDMIDEIDKDIYAIQKEMDALAKNLREVEKTSVPKEQAERDPIQDFLNTFVR